jgi:flagellar protein FlbD
MITLTRISGSVFVLNADLIERVDSTPDTVISLVDGKKYVVLETPDEVSRAVRALRSEILAMSCQVVHDTHDDLRTHAGPTGPGPGRLAPVAPIREDA